MSFERLTHKKHCLFFFNDTATTEIYTLSLHDALPIYEFLRAHTAGVAKHSLHMQARAIDIRLPGVSTRDLRSAALSLHRGGVGYYPRSGFIHVDTGRVTQWCFGCSDGLAD